MARVTYETVKKKAGSGNFDMTQEIATDLAFKITTPSESSVIGGMAVIVGGIGGLAGLIIGAAAFVSAGISSPLLAGIAIAKGYGLLMPLVGGGIGAVGGGVVGGVIGGVARLVMGTAAVGISGGMESLSSIGKAIANVTSRTTKNYFSAGLKKGGLVGAGIGVLLAGACLFTAPAAMTLGGMVALAFNAVTMSAAVCAGMGGFASASVGQVKTIIDARKNPEAASTLTGLEEKLLKARVTERKLRLYNEDLLEEKAAKGFAPSAKAALPQEVYAQLTDDGKIDALQLCFNHGRGDYKEFPQFDASSSNKDAFNAIAADCRALLAQEAAQKAALSTSNARHEEKVNRVLESAPVQQEIKKSLQKGWDPMFNSNF